MIFQSGTIAIIHHFAIKRKTQSTVYRRPTHVAQNLLPTARELGLSKSWPPSSIYNPSGYASALLFYCYYNLAGFWRLVL